MAERLFRLPPAVPSVCCADGAFQSRVTLNLENDLAFVAPGVVNTEADNLAGEVGGVGLMPVQKQPATDRES